MLLPLSQPNGHPSRRAIGQWGPCQDVKRRDQWGKHVSTLPMIHGPLEGLCYSYDNACSGRHSPGLPFRLLEIDPINARLMRAWR